MLIKNTLSLTQELLPHWLINPVSFAETAEESSDTSDDEPEDGAAPDDPIPPPVVIPDENGKGGK